MATFNIFVTIVVASFALAGAFPFFRKDYHLNAIYDSFYKFHLDPVNMTWDSALKTCYKEGAKLFHPIADGEWEAITPLLKSIVDPDNDQYILVGIRHDDIQDQFVTVDGSTPIPLLTVPEVAGNCMYMNIETGIFAKLPCENQPNIRGFVCKREIPKPICNTIDQDYIYDVVENKCHKVHNKKRTWHEAVTTCFVEGGHLAIPKNYIIDNFLETQMYFAGFYRSDKDSQYYSVTGETFETEKIYRGKYSEFKEFPCGTAMIESNRVEHYMTSDCKEKRPFICEAKANSKSAVFS